MIKLYIPDDLIALHIILYIDENIKMLLCKKYYFAYHNKFYKYSYKYLHFLVKNNIVISTSLLTNYKQFNIYKKEKIIFDKKIFFLVYDYCIYLSKKYNNKKFMNYFINLYKSKLQLNNEFSNLHIKGYKNFIDKNILWIK